MKQRSKHFLHQIRSSKRSGMAVLVLLFGIAGSVFFSISHASTYTVAVDPEDSTITAPANQLADTTANGGGAIKFNQPPAADSTTLLAQNFDSLAPASQLSLGTFMTAMGNATSNNYLLPNTSVVSATGHGNVMRQTLQANQYGGSNGIVTFPSLSKTVDEASIQYDIRFDSNFDWSLGGKLPGLGGAEGATTPSTATGCATGNENAWSGRSMWLTPAAGYSSEHPKSPNEWIGYMYNAYKKEACGDNIRTTKSFVAGNWHTVKQYYKMNTPGVADGIHRMWFDGTLVVDNHAFKYRTNAGLHINYLFWAIFRGGNAANWASNHVDTIDIDNLQITTP